RRIADFLDGLALASCEQEDSHEGWSALLHEGSFEVLGSDALAMIVAITPAFWGSISLRTSPDWRGGSFMMMAAATSMFISSSCGAAASAFIVLKISTRPASARTRKSLRRLSQSSYSTF